LHSNQLFTSPAVAAADPRIRHRILQSLPVAAVVGLRIRLRIHPAVVVATRAWQATQLGGSEGEGSGIQGPTKPEIVLVDGREQQAKPEKTPVEEAID